VHVRYGADCPPTDENCGLHTWDMNTVMAGPVAGEFPGELRSPQSLEITEHAIQFSKTKLLLTIFERATLTGEFENRAQTINSWISQVFGGIGCDVNGDCCQQFADAAIPDSGDLNHNVLLQACPQVIHRLEQDVRVSLGAFDIVTTTAPLHLSTSLGCMLSDTDEDDRYDALGSENGRCLWVVDYHGSQNEVATNFGFFYGVRIP
jgi:hypothetical protein